MHFWQTTGRQIKCSTLVSVVQPWTPKKVQGKMLWRDRHQASFARANQILHKQPCKKKAKHCQCVQSWRPALYLWHDSFQALPKKCQELKQKVLQFFMCVLHVHLALWSVSCSHNPMQRRAASAPASPQGTQCLSSDMFHSMADATFQTLMYTKGWLLTMAKMVRAEMIAARPPQMVKRG